jgi:hypothetical protein
MKKKKLIKKKKSNFKLRGTVRLSLCEKKKKKIILQYLHASTFSFYTYVVITYIYIYKKKQIIFYYQVFLLHALNSNDLTITINFIYSFLKVREK